MVPPRTVTVSRVVLTPPISGAVVLLLVNDVLLLSMPVGCLLTELVLNLFANVFALQFFGSILVILFLLFELFDLVQQITLLSILLNQLLLNEQTLHVHVDLLVD